MTPQDIAYARLVTDVWLYGFDMALERMDQWLAVYDASTSHEDRARAANRS